VIGTAQVADCDGGALGKPGARQAAEAQLAAMSGRDVAFRTAVAVAWDGRVDAALDTTVVRFRTLDADAIVRYLDAEAPYDCAGSFRSEGLGITLFEAVESTDPTALVGLPLIATACRLRATGLRLPCRRAGVSRPARSTAAARPSAPPSRRRLPPRCPASAGPAPRRRRPPRPRTPARRCPD